MLEIDQANYDLTEVGYFDVYPNSDSPSFAGSWSNYPYYESGTVIVVKIKVACQFVSASQIRTYKQIFTVR